MPFGEETGTLQGFLEHNINKAMEMRNNYDQFIQYTRLVYEAIQTEDQKTYKHIKKIITEYDKDHDMQRKARMLANAHSDPEASHEYLTARNRDQQLGYDEDFEHAVHTNMTVIITFFGQMMNRYCSEDNVMP